MQEVDLSLLFIRPLEQLRIPYMVTGSVAAIVYGEPRLTHDLDLVIDLSLREVPSFIKAFSGESFYCPPADIIAVEANREQRGHVNVLHIPTGFKVDFYFLGRDPLHAWALSRSRNLKLRGEQVRVAPPEYVITRKLEFFREGGSEKHLRDIRLMLKVSGKIVDQTELSRLVAERGLQDYWAKVSDDRS